MIRSSRGFRLDYAPSLELARLGRRRYSWATMVARGEVLAVVAGLTFMLLLLGPCSLVVLVLGSFFFPRRARLDAAFPAAVADAGDVGVVDDHGLAVDVGHVGDVHVGDRAVVVERATAPLAALEAGAAV